MSKNVLVVILIFILTFIYSVLRYNVFGNIPYEDIPMFIVNKAFSFSMIIILLIALIRRLKKKHSNNSFYYGTFKIFTVIHVLISLALLSQNYYPKFFADGKLTLFGNLAILAGIVASLILIRKINTFINIFFLILTSAHLFFMGFKGWLDVEKWNGSMPPITLLCFLMVVILIITASLKRKSLEIDPSREMMQNSSTF